MVLAYLKNGEKNHKEVSIKDSDRMILNLVKNNVDEVLIDGESIFKKYTFRSVTRGIEHKVTKYQYNGYNFDLEEIIHELELRVKKHEEKKEELKKQLDSLFKMMEV